MTGAVSSARSGAVTLNGVVDGEGLGFEECKFEYVSEAAFKTDGWANATEAVCTPEAGKIPKEKNQPVHAEVEHLSSGSVYRYRLVAATNSGAHGGVNEHGGVKEGMAESFAAPAEPVVEGVSVSDVSSSWVDFHAVIDPVGERTTYHFEYLSAAAFAADGDSWAGAIAPTSVPVLGAEVGSGDTGVSVDVQAGGLSPGTTYDFRVVASSGEGVTDGGNGVFATSPAAVPGLADGRVYEMLTPPNKEDGEDMFGVPANNEGVQRAEEGLGGATSDDFGYSSEDGEHFLLWTGSAFGSFPASGNGDYVFSRGSAGWSVQSAASPSLGVQSLASIVYDPANFSALGVNDALAAGGATLGRAPEANLVGPVGGPYATVHSGTGNTPTVAAIVGGSADLSYVVLESPDHELTASDKAQDAGSEALYEWTAAMGLRLVNLNAEGKLLKCGAVLGIAGFEDTGAFGGTHGAVSSDGAKVFFTAPDPHAQNAGSGCWNGGTENPPQLYMREDGERTVEVSAPEKGVKGTPGSPAEPAIYVGASSDGSKVFFLTKTELTKEAEELGLHDVELYEYNSDPDAGEAALTRISCGAAGIAGGVEDVPAVAGDGSAVYFNATSQLTSKAPAGGGLYRYDTLTHTIAYVAPNPGYPAPQNHRGNGVVGETWYTKILGTEGVEEHYAGLDVRAPYYATADGEFLVFASSGDITGYDSGGKPELYRYHYEPASPSGGSIVCVSCNPNGSVPSYGATFTRSAVHGDNPAGTAPRPISENGEYVFFDTQESLLPADTNDRVDVYAWHETPASHEGAVSLITTGQDTSDSFFLDSSPDGRNVFFGTHARLVPADEDNQGNLYDARIEGGFPAPLGAGPCEGDACQNPPPAPIYATPTSLAFTGPSDIFTEMTPPTKTVTKKAAARCKKPKRLSRGKCVTPKKKARAKKASRDRRSKS